MTIGILPTAGAATRIHGLPKWLLPIPGGYLLGKHIMDMQYNHVQVVIATSPENVSLVEKYKRNAFVHVATNYKTMSETVLSCWLRSTGENIIFGMPDSYVEDDQCYPKLTRALDDGADVAVALFRARHKQHLKAGMCDTRGNQVVTVIDKPAETKFTRLWGALAWKPAFWEYLRPEDPHVGYALPRAIAAGLDVRAIRMDGGYWDCGTTLEYFELVNHLHGRKEIEEITQIYG